MLEHWSGWVFAYLMLGFVFNAFGGLLLLNSQPRLDNNTERGVIAVMVLTGWWLWVIVIGTQKLLWLIGYTLKRLGA